MSETNLDQWEPIPDYGSHMAVEEFQRLRKGGWCSDWNGHGEWATATHLPKYMSYMIRDENSPPEWATHVVWFGK